MKIVVLHPLTILLKLAKNSSFITGTFREMRSTCVIELYSIEISCMKSTTHVGLWIKVQIDAK